MPDITMCKGEGCPKKDLCYRHTAKPTPHWQSYFVKAPYDPETQTCEYEDIVPIEPKADK